MGRRVGRGMLLIAVLGLCAGAPTPAHAAFKGTPGKIAFVDGDDSDHLNLMVWDPNGDGTPQVYDSHVADDAPSWSPDGTRIAYVKNLTDGATGDTQSVIYAINADGTDPEQISHPPADKADDTQGSCEDGASDLYLDQGYHYNDKAPTWGPGDQVAFVRYFSGDPAKQMLCDGGISAGCDFPYTTQPEQNLWTVNVSHHTPGSAAPTSGFGDARLTHDQNTLTNGIIWNAPAWSKDGTIAAERVSFHGCAADPGLTSTIDLRRLATDAGGSSGTVGDASKILNYDWSPDGDRLAVAFKDGGGHHHVVVYDYGDSGIGQQTVADANLIRFSPDGNGVLSDGCVTDSSGDEQCGMVEHRLPDPEGDVRDSDPTDRYIQPYTGDAIDVGVYNTRGDIDVQAQQLPVIFIPGFLGSEITCNGATQWFTVPPDLLGMRLGPDGASTEGCPGSAPDGKLVTFYSSVEGWVKDTFGDRGSTFGWDWRKAPQQTLSRLDGAITDALKAPIAQDEGATRVTIMAHSYGGLLTRMYLDDAAHAKRIARVLTVGTPYWGAPKSIFPPAFGIESPGNKDNIVFNVDELKTFSHNLAGMLQLLPSPSYGPWLTVGDRGNADSDQTLSGGDLTGFLVSLGISGSLYSAAQANHTSTYDHFTTNGGKIDVRQVVGLGLATPGSVTIERDGATNATATIGWTNGDGTVPGRSATTGDIGSQPDDPDVHIQDICGIGHMDESDTPQVTNNYKDFLDQGRTPRKTHVTASGCPFHVGLLDFDSASGTLGQPSSRRARSSTPLTLDEAYAQGLIDLYSFPADRLAVVDRSAPVTIGGQASGLTFTYTEVSSAGVGRVLRYGPVSGDLRFTPSATGDPVVTADGVAVTPTVLSEGGTTPGSGDGSGGSGPPANGGDSGGASAGSPGGTGGGSSPGGAGGGSSPGGAGTSPGAGDATAGKPRDTFKGITFTRKSVSVTSGRAAFLLRCPAKTPGGCRGKLTVRTASKVVVGHTKHKRPRRAVAVLGHASFKIAAGRSHTVKVKLSRTGAKLLTTHRSLRCRVTVAATDALGTSRSRTASTTLRRAKKARRRR